MANLTFDEITSVISTRSLAMFHVLQEIQKIEMEKILDKLESVM